MFTKWRWTNERRLDRCFERPYLSAWSNAFYYMGFRLYIVTFVLLDREVAGKSFCVRSSTGERKRRYILYIGFVQNFECYRIVRSIQQVQVQVQSQHTISLSLIFQARDSIATLYHGDLITNCHTALSHWCASYLMDDAIPSYSLSSPCSPSSHIGHSVVPVLSFFVLFTC